MNFLFIPNIKNLCKYYDLDDLKATKRFLRIADYIRYYIYFLSAIMEGYFLFFLSRCLLLSYSELSFTHFLYISLPFFIITQLSYHWMTFSYLSICLFLFLTQKFIILRVQLISEKILRLANNLKCSKDSKKKKENSLKIIKTINDIILQFYQSNIIFDKTISLVYLNLLVVSVFLLFFFEII